MSSRPAAYRWTPAFSMMLVSLISYVDRNTLALLAPTILRETGLSQEQYGFIISGFSFAYMIGNPVWGRVLDRIGLRQGMTAAVCCWTAASVSHAFAGGFWSFAAARTALGFGEGATFPGGLRTVVQTLRIDERGRGIALAYSGGSLGAIVTPLVITPIFLWFGWRAAFWFTGLIGVGWVAVWALISRREDIRIRPAAAESVSVAPRWADRRLWAFMFSYALGGMPLAFVLYGAPLYLSGAMGRSQEFIGKVLWIPPLAWEIGYFFWGAVLDRFSPRFKNILPPLRRLFAACALLYVSLALVPLTSSVALTLALISVAMFAAAGAVVLSVAYATRVYSSDHSGLIAGVGAGSWGAAVAVAMPYFGRLFDQHRYDAAFLISAAVPVIGYLGWLSLSRPAPRLE